MFRLTADTPIGRLGTLKTAHGTLQTPFFLPVATAGAMKGISFEELLSIGAEVLLSNTYHLHITPGENVVHKAGGLHKFIGWNKPMLTDSGGFQVFSLRSIRSITDHGVHFQSHRDGKPLFIGPEESISIQHKLGADIIMCFDECPPSTASRSDQIKAVDRTLRWAKECKRVHLSLLHKKSPKKSVVSGQRSVRKRSKNCPLSTLSGEVRFERTKSDDHCPLLFGIIQGGLERDLRERCAQELIAIGFDGYAAGGLAVGETESEMLGVLKAVCPILPKDKPRYLMGVGDLKQQRKAVAMGIDMFDCVAAMREARHGSIWLTNGKKIRILRAEYKNDHSAVDEDSPSPLSRTHLKSYLHHLMKLHERYGETIACMQNMALTLQAMRIIRAKIKNSTAKN